MDLKIEKEHHLRTPLCKIRPAYRQGRKLTAVKSYTVNNESQHLFVYGVPQISLRAELRSLCLKFGKVLNIHLVSDHKTEIFTECFHVQYDRIQSARIAKRLMDDRSFYGSILHVCYAPEYESVAETRQKLFQRCKDVLVRLQNNTTAKSFVYDHPDGETEDYYHKRYEIDVYENDPILAASRKRKGEDHVDTASIGNSFDVSSEENSETHLQVKRSDGKDSNEFSRQLIPMQALKYKRNLNTNKKRIIFHNKHNIT